MNIKILDDAKNDLLSGYYFYRKQSTGLGGYFLESLMSDIDSLKKYYGIHQKFIKDYFRKLSKKFPYAIYYSLEKDTLYIHAVLDTRIDPVKIINRFEK